MIQIEFMNGQFSKSDALNFATQLIALRIRQQENQISLSDSEEDIKQKESGIKQLQASLQKVHDAIESGRGEIRLSSNLIIQ